MFILKELREWGWGDKKSVDKDSGDSLQKIEDDDEFCDEKIQHLIPKTGRGDKRELKLS